MPFGQAVLSAVSVGIGCGAGCGSAASAFLTTYVVSEGLKWSSSMRQVLSFYLGKMVAVLLVCAAGSLIGQAFTPCSKVCKNSDPARAIRAVRFGNQAIARQC